MDFHTPNGTGSISVAENGAFSPLIISLIGLFGRHSSHNSPPGVRLGVPLPWQHKACVTRWSGLEGQVEAKP